MPYYSDNNDYVANRVGSQIARDTAHAYDRERSVASKVIHAAGDIAVAVLTAVFGPVVGVLSSIVHAVMDFILD